MAVHVHHNSWYISFPSSAIQQCEITNFQLFLQRGPLRLSFRILFGAEGSRIIFSRGKFPKNALNRSGRVDNPSQEPINMAGLIMSYCRSINFSCSQLFSAS